MSSSEQNNQDLDHKVQDILQDASLSNGKKYALLAVGNTSKWSLFIYELKTLLLGSLPGALGLLLRKKCYPSLFKSCGRNLTIGRNVTLRGVSKIELGSHVFIDDNVTIDARGNRAKVILGDGVFVSRHTVIRSRGDSIEIGDRSDIGTHCIVSTDSNLKLGSDVLVGAFSYICAGGNHNFDDRSVPIIKQGFTSKGGVTIADGVWVGAHCSIFDGVTIGEGSIIGAHSMVNKSLGEMKICHGVPAIEVKDRP